MRRGSRVLRDTQGVSGTSSLQGCPEGFRRRQGLGMPGGSPGRGTSFLERCLERAWRPGPPGGERGLSDASPRSSHEVTVTSWARDSRRWEGFGISGLPEALWNLSGEKGTCLRIDTAVHT